MSSQSRESLPHLVIRDDGHSSELVRHVDAAPAGPFLKALLLQVALPVVLPYYRSLQPAGP